MNKNMKRALKEMYEPKPDMYSITDEQIKLIERIDAQGYIIDEDGDVCLLTPKGKALLAELKKTSLSK